MTSLASGWLYKKHKGAREMELILIIAILAGLLVLDVLAVTFGADSRETLLDDWAR